MSRDPFFANMANNGGNKKRMSGSTVSNTNGQPTTAIQSTDQSFPPIDTFSIESVTGGGNQQQHSSNSSNQSHDIFGGNNMMNGGNGGGGGGGHDGGGNMNGGGGGGHPNNQYNHIGPVNNNSSGGDVNQATRETGIIEKMLVCFEIVFYSWQSYLTVYLTPHKIVRLKAAFLRLHSML